jgi:hypothetical protein
VSAALLWGTGHNNAMGCFQCVLFIMYVVVHFDLQSLFRTTARPSMVLWLIPTVSSSLGCGFVLLTLLSTQVITWSRLAISINQTRTPISTSHGVNSQYTSLRNMSCLVEFVHDGRVSILSIPSRFEISIDQITT